MNKSEKTRQYIIETAAPIFNKKGYAGTSLSDIIENTGLTKGAIYGHFENKDDLAVAATVHNLKTVSTKIFSAAKLQQNSCDKLTAFAGSYLVFYDEINQSGGCPVLNGAVDSDDGNPAIRMKIRKFIEMWEKTIIDITGDGIKQGEISVSSDPVEFSILFISLIEGGIMLSKTMKDKKYLEKAVAHINAIIEQMKI
jgi:TetR/AcrR family transcriptional regulator, transcriptional repressor for nem operon